MITIPKSRIPLAKLVGEVLTLQFSAGAGPCRLLCDWERLQDAECDDAFKHVVVEMASGTRPPKGSDLLLLAQADALKTGIKVFKPTLDQCEAMALSDARIPVSEYRQPFAPLFFQIPSEFYKMCGFEEHQECILWNPAPQLVFFSFNTRSFRFTTDTDRAKTIEQRLRQVTDPKWLMDTYDERRKSILSEEEIEDERDD